MHFELFAIKPFLFSYLFKTEKQIIEAQKDILSDKILAFFGFL